MPFEEITPSEAVTRLVGDPATLLLDVREPHEVAYAAVPGTVHIPMAEVPERLGELGDSRPVIVLCHHGERSLQVAMYLERCGFDDVANVAGGIDAWSTEVDPTIPRYS